ncbi:NTP transferase domain-containing protein [Candidatus Daviesbacteria bacterium]|nr:NTP transferase domain-containing protein [Candidatus Daviesbacteria bacterium]
MYQNLGAVIFAAGEGKRMESDLPKVLHPINGTPMILITLKKLVDLGIQNITVVVGYKAEEVKKVIHLAFHLRGVKLKYALQEKPLGTADALKTALKVIKPQTEQILVLNGDDSVFYSEQTLNDFISSHLVSDAFVSVLTVNKDDADLIGRVVRDDQGKFLKILEHADYLESGHNSKEINCGTYVFNKRWLESNISKVPINQKGEYYLTDLINIDKEEGFHINLVELKNPQEWLGINTKEELEKAQLSFE